MGYGGDVEYAGDVPSLVFEWRWRWGVQQMFGEGRGLWVTGVKG